MEPSIYDSLSRKVQMDGPAAAIDELIDALRDAKEYHRMFEAMTLRARFDLGLPLIQTSSTQELPKDTRTRYEDGIIEACRIVGGLFLDVGDVGNAYRYLNMIGEVEPVRDAIERMPLEGETVDESWIEVAMHHGVHPRKGLELILKRYGICQAITACQGILAQPGKTESREECVRLLIRALHEELVIRLVDEIARREGTEPVARTIPMLLKGREWLFENDNYHIDTSHLNSVVRLARLLGKCDETFLAIQLCEYGKNLSERYSYPDPSPFEKVYEDSQTYLKVLAGIDVERGLAHFRAKAESANPAETGSYPLEMFVNLLVHTGRLHEAIDYASKGIGMEDYGSASPSINELCQRAKDFDALARWARERGDVVSFAAGIIQKIPGNRA